MPLDFTFTEDQELFRRSVRELVAKTVTPNAKQLLEARTLTPPVHKALRELGLFGLLISEKYGGSGADYVTFTIAVEELTRGDPSGFAGLPVWYGASCARLIEAHGTPDLKAEVLPKVTKEGWITPLHSTEPGCGTDFTAITTKAEKSRGEYVVNGAKTCVSCIPEVLRYGGGFITTVKTQPELASKGMSLLFIPGNANGLSSSNFTGIGIDIGEVRYENTRVPERNLIGKEGLGYQLTNDSFVHARVPTTMSIVAAAEGALEKGIEYLKQRKTFGRPLAAHEGMQFELAEDYANVEAAKWLCYRAAWVIDRYHAGKASIGDAMIAASTAKLVASEQCVNTISDILEWYGGLGTTTAYDIQHVFRIVRQAVIAEGTKNAQKLVIALQLLGREFAAWEKWE
jgi:acyl-CoA dehydrogenase